jgi:protein ImuA
MAGDAVARETLFALRETIARLEGRPVPALAAAAQEAMAAGQMGEMPQSKEERREKPPLSIGVADFDEALEGGIKLDALTEIRSQALRDAGAATGFALALASRLRAQADGRPGRCSPVLWIGDVVSTMEAGLPYAIGLKQFGLETGGFFQAFPRKLDEALWLAETALESAVFAVVILEVRGNPARFGLTESRRLALRAKAAGRPLFLLRQAGEEEASSAFHRLCIEPAPALARPLPDGSLLGGSIGNSSFRLVLEKSRNPAPLSFVLEWNAHDRQFSSVAAGQRPTVPRARSAHSGAGLSASADRSDRAQEMGSLLAFSGAFEGVFGRTA